MVQAAAALRAKSRADGLGHPLGYILTGGEALDYKAVDALIALPIARPRLMLADKGYDSDDVRTSLLPVIVPKANRKQAIDCDFRAYEERNRVERWFNELKHLRRNVTPLGKAAADKISPFMDPTRQIVRTAWNLLLWEGGSSQAAR